MFSRFIRNITNATNVTTQYASTTTYRIKLLNFILLTEVEYLTINLAGLRFGSTANYVWLYAFWDLKPNKITPQLGLKFGSFVKSILLWSY